MTVNTADGAVLVETPSGPVSARFEDSVVVARGIPYARAERFGHPTPVDPWSSPLDASHHGAQAPQLPGALERLLGGLDLPTSEDCQHLDVYTPACDDRRRPVLVWIHGGAFVNGGGSMPWYHGASLARRGDVVVVTINYRLGALGFAGTTNGGLADQVAALEWVRDHIAAFGGDPGRVTVFGESAGGTSVIALMAVPRAAALFRSAWAMSPSLTQLRRPERAADALGELLDAAEVDDLDALARLDLDRLLTAQTVVLGRRSSALTAFAPTVDGDLLPEPVLRTAAADPRPLALGTLRDEMMLFTAFDPDVVALEEPGLREAVELRLGERWEPALEEYRRCRPGARPGELLSAVQTDEAFRVPATRLADRRAEAGAPTWRWWFTWATPAFHGRLGACHGLDIPFAFANLDRRGVEMFTGSGPERVALVEEFACSLIRFAHDAEPGWSPYDTDRRPTRIVDVDARTADDPEAELRLIWDGVTVR